MIEIKTAHLFSGINAAEYAAQLHSLPFNFLYTSEIYKQAIAVQEKNFPNLTCYGDISTIVDRNDLPEIDLAIAGTSCQSFSVNGDGTGFEGSSGIITEFWRYLKKYQPRSFLWENVSAIVKPSKRQTFLKIIHAFTGSLVLDCPNNPYITFHKDGSGHVSSWHPDGYNIAWVILNAKDTSPQNRERVYMIGFKDVPASDIYHQLKDGKEESISRRILGRCPIDGELPIHENRPELDFSNYIEQPENPEFLSKEALEAIAKKNIDSKDCYVQVLARMAYAMSTNPDLTAPISLGGAFVTSETKVVFEETTRRLLSSSNHKLPRQRLLTPCLTVGDSGTTGKGNSGSKKLALFYVEDGLMRCRRSTITETERLQGFSPDWTKVGKLADGTRRRLIGNSMSIGSLTIAMKVIVQLWEK